MKATLSRDRAIGWKKGVLAMTNSSGVATGTEVVMPHEGGPEVLEVVRRGGVRDPRAGEAVVRVEGAGLR